MTTSRSIALASNRAARVLATAIAVLCLVAWTRSAQAERIVVLEFSGPKAAKFQKPVENMLKKSNTIVPASKWKKTAAKLKAKKTTAGNVKKVAKKLKVDSVIDGTVKKKGKGYVVSVVVLSGRTGESVGEAEVRTKGAKLSAKELRDLRAQLEPSIGGGGGEAVASTDDEAGGSGGDEAGGGGGDENSGFGGNNEEMKGRDRVASTDDTGAAGGSDQELPPPADGEEKRVATADEKPEGEVTERPEEPGTAAAVNMLNAAVDVSVGPSATVRSLDFTVADGLADKPQNYAGTPVAGAYVAANVFPLAFGGGKGFISRFGITAMIDRVIKIESRLTYNNPPQTVLLPTTEQHFAVGVMYRHPLGDSLTLEGSVRYNSLTFEIDKGAAPEGVKVDLPNTDYVYFDPGIGLRYMLSTSLSMGADVRGLLVTSSGEIGTQDAENGYGEATVTGFDAGAAADYLITDRLFARLGLRATLIGFSFKGGGDNLSNNRDDNTATVDVSGARDTYLGGFLTVGYLL